MDPGPLASQRSEDELADLAVRRGRTAGAPWIVASVVAFGFGLATGSPGGFAAAWAAGVALFSAGLLVRRRYWRGARRQLGDATIQRAQWRCADRERDGSERIVAAIVLVMVLLAFQAWSR
jgi:hypothetical protein